MDRVLSNLYFLLALLLLPYGYNCFFMVYALVGMALAYIHQAWSMLFYLTIYFLGYLTIVYYMSV